MIAAAAAAAAEVGRSEGADAARGGGFLGLSRFPDVLMEKQQDGTSLLFHLSRLQPAARRIFALLMAGLDGAAEATQASHPAVRGARSSGDCSGQGRGPFRFARWSAPFLGWP